MPAMVAKVQAPDGRFAGIHVTYLEPDGGRKAIGVPETKLIFGCVGLALSVCPKRTTLWR